MKLFFFSNSFLGDKDDCSAQQTTTGFGSLRKSGKSSKQQIEPQHLVTPDLISNTTRKNSAPNSSTGFSYLTKLSFPSSSKEKKKPSIGSPGVMFRHNSKQQQSISPDGEVFTQIMLPSRVRRQLDNLFPVKPTTLLILIYRTTTAPISMSTCLQILEKHQIT